MYHKELDFLGDQAKILSKYNRKLGFRSDPDDYIDEETKKNREIKRKKQFIAHACGLPDSMIDDLEGTDYPEIRESAKRILGRWGLLPSQRIITDEEAVREAIYPPTMDRLLSRLSDDTKSKNTEERVFSQDGLEELAERLNLI